MQVKISTDKGVVATSQGVGDELLFESELNIENVRYEPTTLTKSGSITRGGLYYLSSSGACAHLKIALPVASTVPGELFIFRAISTGSHMITASNEGAGKVIQPRIVMQYSGNQAASSMPVGSLLRFPKVTQGTHITGSSATLLCDGQSFLVLALSGSGFTCTTAAQVDA